MKLTAQQVYDRLINDDQILSSKGRITFHLANIDIIVRQRDVVGNIMQEWVDALLAADSMRELGYTPDDFIGSWSEKFDGNGRITVEKGAKGSYDIRIERPREDGKIDIWEMTGRPAGDGGILYYEYGKHIIRTDGSEEYSDNVQYENGTGRLTLNSAFEIMWQDDVDHAGDNAVFVNEG